MVSGVPHPAGPSVASFFVTLLPVRARLVLTRCRWLFASAEARDAEILALRHQVLVLQRQINRPRFNEKDRTVLALLSSVMDRARRGRSLLIVRPATVLAWHRRLVARRRTQPPSARPGRPSVDPDIGRLIVRLARKNPTWGYRRSMANSTGSVTSSRRRLCGRSCALRASTRVAIAPGHRGRSSSISGQRSHRHRLRLCRHRAAPPIPRPVRH